MSAIETAWMKLIGQHLRRENDDLTRNKLPRRWVDLIHYLDEQERKRGRPTGHQSDDRLKH